MWTEHVDVTNLDCRIWPRGGAIASSLWGLDLATADLMSESQPQYEILNQTDLKYLAASGKALIQSYIRHRYFLVSRGILASPLTFHDTDDMDESKFAYFKQYTPRTFSTEQDLYRYINNRNTLPFRGVNRFDIGSLHLTSQCPEIDKDVFRPLNKADLRHVETATNKKFRKKSSLHNVYKAIVINTADGFPGDRRDMMTAWLKHKANIGVDIIGMHTENLYLLPEIFTLLMMTTSGMIELNGWHKLESTSVNHLHKNFPRFRSYAASVGFVNSYVMHSSEHPYNIGIMASLPFTVVCEYKGPPFERGVLHVRFMSINVHVILAHLNSHDSLKRESECEALVSILAPLLRDGMFTTSSFVYFLTCILWQKKRSYLWAILIRFLRWIAVSMKKSGCPKSCLVIMRHFPIYNKNYSIKLDI